MKTTSSSKIDGGRRRCATCGHPRKEHLTLSTCSVPKCECGAYASTEKDG